MLNPHIFLCASLAIPPGRKMRRRIRFSLPSQNTFDLPLLSEQTRHFFTFTFHQRMRWSHRHLSVSRMTVMPRSGTASVKFIKKFRPTA